MSNFEGILWNSKIAFLNQRIFPLQVYNSDASPMPIPVASFPPTTLGFYYLKEGKHCMLSPMKPLIRVTNTVKSSG